MHQLKETSIGASESAMLEQAILAGEEKDKALQLTLSNSDDAVTANALVEIIMQDNGHPGAIVHCVGTEDECNIHRDLLVLKASIDKADELRGVEKRDHRGPPAGTIPTRIR